MIRVRNGEVNVRSQAKLDERKLSNFWAVPGGYFVDDVWCASAEGAIQALKFSDPEEQRSVCAMSGLDAKMSSRIRLGPLRAFDLAHLNAISMPHLA